ncbi:hypothetical protein E8E13_001963 [Curvularia kusanoi]|uniref:Diphthine--ammonia ligase n=1 Tax=Curvularia kusanoi TaxID=90978 RepID=A0A9P4T4P0_CURKU|nr:hypothetical protein E8E13_001963 [Curvularia kusanoi]
MALNVIALISGGKDSFFSILHCIANGHTVVALANLHPSSSASSSNEGDLNSYMYQTVGHSVIPLYEEALGLPLYRQEITGKAVNSSRDYAFNPQSSGDGANPQEQDETEDLVPLLRKVMHAHPEANAVCSGAILSTYQRTRVESVALRLGLTPLSFLWQYPVLPPYSQSQLLLDMGAVGQEAVIIKTASGGLDERILGWNVAAQSTIARLKKGMAMFGEESNGAVVGEGGEFETLALDGPSPVWRKRIRIEPGAAGVSEGGQSVLRMRASELEEKKDSVEGNGDWLAALRIPDLFDDEFKRVLQAVEKALSSSHNTNTNADARSFVSDTATLVNPPAPISPSTSSPFSSLPRNASVDAPTVFTYSNLSDTSRSASSSSAPSPSRQLTKLLLRLDHVLKQWHLSRSEINHCTLLLRNMSDFSTLNPIYGQYFSGVNPPARVTVAVGDCMPSGIDVLLSITIDKPGRDRKGKITRPVDRQGLHVQGRSYWAPANIGPYSQAVSVRVPVSSAQSAQGEGSGSGSSSSAGEVVYVAGQIPLIPSSMELYTQDGFKGQAVLALQHLWRIGRAKGVRWWTGAVGYITPSPSEPATLSKVRTAQAAWRAIHSRNQKLDEDEDDNDNEYPSDSDSDEDEDEVSIDPWDRRNTHAPSFNDATLRNPLPDTSAIHPPTSTTPPVFIVQVAALPRDAAIEWSCTGLTSISLSTTSSPLAPSLSLTKPTHPSGSTFFALAINAPADTDALRHLGPDSVREWSAATLYVSPGFGGQSGEYRKFGWRGVQWVPVERCWDGEGRECSAVLVGRVDREGDGGERRGSAAGRGMGELMGKLKFAGKEVREALEGVGA